MKLQGSLDQSKFLWLFFDVKGRLGVDISSGELLKFFCGAGGASTGLGEIDFVVLGGEPTNFGVFEMKSTGVDVMGVSIVIVVDKIVPGVVISS